MNPILYPQRRHLNHATPWGLEYPEFFLTICCQPRGLNQLCHPGVGERVLRLVRKYQETRRWHCSIALLMPDHLHLMVQIPEKLKLVEIIRHFKQACAKRAGIQWQRGFFDHRIRQDESAQNKYRYIEMNPVRAGFVAEPAKWSWRIVFNNRGEEMFPGRGEQSIARPIEISNMEASNNPSGKQRNLLAPTGPYPRFIDPDFNIR